MEVKLSESNILLGSCENVGGPGYMNEIDLPNDHWYHVKFRSQLWKGPLETRVQIPKFAKDNY